MKDKLLIKILAVAIVFAFSACQKSAADNVNISPSLVVAVPTQISAPTPMPNLNSPIRKVDFKNFTYPETDGYEGFKLKNSEKSYIHQQEDGIYLGKVDYTDVTGDGVEDAILLMGIQTGGSAIPTLIYLYTLENKKPKLLWAFMTGDRADGGLKDIYAINDELIIELFGDSKVINDEWKFDYPEEKYAGAGNPTIYTKNRFKWNGKKFVTVGNPELFDYKRENLPVKNN
ncbi:MAG: hypothetical protein M3Q99_12425 [Acidobacteriota bacterium]|nr:hypothetical protein [Acidobacteriota bacterium]